MNSNKLVSGYGEKYTNTIKHKGMPWYHERLLEVSHDEIRDRIANPTNVPKSESQWVLCSNYQSRLRDEQLEHGEFSMIWADMDTLDASFDMETLSFYIESIAPGTQCFLHTTSSWSAKKPKYRALFLLDECIDSKTWITAQKSLSRIFKAAGVKLDNVTTRVQQPCYLPNVDPSNDLANYQYRIFEGKRDIDWLREEMVVVAEIEKEEKRLAEESATLRAAEIALYGDDARKPKEVKLFNSVTDLAELMLSVGYTQRSSRPDSEGFMHYRSPNQSGSSYATRIYPGSGRWSSRSSSDSEMGTWNGEDASGDASDIYTWFATEEDGKTSKFNQDPKKFRAWVRNNVMNEEGYTLAQLEAMKMFEAVERQKENLEVINTPVLEPVDVCKAFDLITKPLGGLVNQQSMDADAILVGAFKNRTALLSNSFHWFTGDRWEHVDDIWVEGHVSKALDGCEKENTLQRVRNVTGQIKRRCKNYGDSDPTSRLVFFKNGVYNLETDEVTPHNRENLNTSVFPVAYNPNAEQKLWLNWLRDIFEGDLGRIDLLQEIMGWCLISDNLNIQKSILMFGASRAGKGTIGEVMLAMLGESTTSFNFDSLTNAKGLNSCLQANVAFDTDAAGPKPGDSKSVMALMKKLTSNEKVSVPQLYQNNSANVRLNCKFVIMANGIPKIYDDSGVMAKRWIPLHFTKSFDGREDGDLSKKLIEDLEFIAQWALEGLKRLKKNGRFTMPQSSKDQLANLLASGSPLQPFIDSALECDADERVAAANVWTAYVQWCFENQEPEPDLKKKRTFYESLSSNLVSQGVIMSPKIRIDGKITTGFKGLKIKPKIPTVLQVVK